MNREREYFRQKQRKKYKKVIDEEESHSKPELEENQYKSKELEEEIEKPNIQKKTGHRKTKN